MEIIIHRVNTIKKLIKIPKNYGAEIDIRVYKNKLILNHEPYSNGELLVNFVKKYNHGTLVLNIKESGIENDVLKIVRRNKKIKNFFLLDVEVPFLFSSLLSREKSIALRTSYYEPLNSIKNFKKNFEWIWIDTIKNIKFSNEDLKQLKKYKTCLVCPERWGKPNQIIKYNNYFKKKGIKLNSVMTSLKYAKIWRKISI